MKELSRRAFVGRLIAVGASSAVLGEAARGQLVLTKAEWKVEDFQTLVHVPRRIKQVFDASVMNGGTSRSPERTSDGCVNLTAGRLGAAMLHPSASLGSHDWRLAR
jgi:hypothetical protein